MNLDTRQRNMLAKKMGNGGWHLQIDSDEYPYDFKILSDFLRKNSFLLKNPVRTPATILVNFVTLFKEENGFFVVKPFAEACYIATNSPEYTNARVTKNGKHYRLNFNLIHRSWARSDGEIREKIANWGHKDDFDTMSFFKKWQDLGAENYKDYKDFHPLNRADWHSLEYFPAGSEAEFIEQFEKKYPQKQLRLPILKLIKLRLKSLI